MFPLLLLAGMLLPIDDGPAWLRSLSKLNPLTYGRCGARWPSRSARPARRPRHPDTFAMDRPSQPHVPRSGTGLVDLHHTEVDS
jgi:hypothetical protein